MGSQKTGYLQRAAVLTAHPQCQGFHPALQQETGMGIQGAAQMIEFVGDPPNQFSFSDQCPGNEITMPIEVFGAAVDRQVEAPLRRAEVNRTGKGIVDHRHQVVPAGEVCHRL